MAKQRGKIGKYSKITLQKKYELLKLSQFGKNNLKETSEHLQINYSTAKTIFFQYQNNKTKNRLKFFQTDASCSNSQKKQKFFTPIATYKEKLFVEKGLKEIQLVCSSRPQKPQFDRKPLKDGAQEQRIVETEEKGSVVQLEGNQKIETSKFIVCMPRHQQEYVDLQRAEQFGQNMEKFESKLGSDSLQQEFKYEKTLNAQTSVNINPIMYYFPYSQYQYCCFQPINIPMGMEFL